MTNKPFSKSVETGHELRVDMTSGEIVNLTTQVVISTPPLEGIVRAIIEAGGLHQLRQGQDDGIPGLNPVQRYEKRQERGKKQD